MMTTFACKLMFLKTVYALNEYCRPMCKGLWHGKEFNCAKSTEG